MSKKQSKVEVKRVYYSSQPTVSHFNMPISSGSITSTPTGEFTREDFIGVLEKASRQVKPRRGKGKSKTSE